MAKLIRGESTDRPRVDWRGWIILAWAIFWGVSYCNMALRARGRRVLDWVRPHQARVAKDRRASVATLIGPGARQGDRFSGASRSQARQ
jgi:hypothetical protein